MKKIIFVLFAITNSIFSQEDLPELNFDVNNVNLETLEVNDNSLDSIESIIEKSPEELEEITKSDIIDVEKDVEVTLQ